ncbi:MAG: DUF4838 domain-containing protein, partial [Clostridia bacterium]|nr:DUF4838 domain-containing protein [Clostridia bacterium]
VTGRGDGRFSPADNITRAELASILTKFVTYMDIDLPDNSKIDSFKDADTFDSWMNAPIEAVRKNGLMQGTDGKFNPRGNATRAEIAQVIKNLLPDVGRQNVVENGKSDYVIVIDEGNTAAVDAAERLQYQIKYSTGAELKIVDDSTKATAKEIVIGDVRSNPIGKASLTGDAYEVAVKDGKVYVNSADADGLYRGAVRFAKAAINGDDARITSKTAEREEFSYPIGKLTINGNDISKYQILYPGDASENTMIGVNDLAEYIGKATGVKLNTKIGTSGDYAIIVKEETLKLKDAGNDVDSFSVKSSGNSIILTGSAERGAMYACYDFLEDVIGWCFMTETQDYLEPVEELDITGLDYSEKSVFMHREDYWGTYINSSDMENKHKMWQIPHTGGKQHTFQSLTDGQYDQSTQPCLSDPAIRELMLKNVRILLAANPDAQLISVSQNDNYDKCECDKCLASYEKYGSPAGINLELVNYIAEDIEDDYPNVLIHTFAYIYSLPAPVGITPHENVIVQVCSLEQCFRHPLTASCNDDDFAVHLQDWAKIGAKMYIWDYTTNFSYSPVGMSNFSYDVLAGNMKLFADSNAMGVFAQGNHCVVEERGEFDRLRAYLLAKLLWDPYMSEEEYNAHIEKFMKGYYGEGWEDIRDVLFEWIATDKQCHRIFDTLTGRYMQFFGKNITTKWVDTFANAELLTESKTIFENCDRNQLMFDLLEASVRFGTLTKSTDEVDHALAQKLCRNVQNKMLYYNVSYGNVVYMFPNMETFDTNPALWKQLEEPDVVWSYSDVTVDIPTSPFWD